jgi:hypothetical protein
MCAGMTGGSQQPGRLALEIVKGDLAVPGEKAVAIKACAHGRQQSKCPGLLGCHGCLRGGERQRRPCGAGRLIEGLRGGGAW